MAGVRAKRKSSRSRKNVAVIGLGYVGLPLACLAAEKGFRVFGLDRDQAKVDLINQQKSPIDDTTLRRWLKRVNIVASTDDKPLRSATVIVICVPTPVDHDYMPDLRPVKDAAERVRRHLRKGQLIILESTVNPGVSEEVVQPILEKSGLRAGRDFTLAHCPERINPGDKKWNVRNIPRVVGATDPKGLRKAVAFYSTLVSGPVRPMRSIKEAEATKILENSFRDINIAFINEIAQSFDKLGIDVLDVIEGAKTKPFAFLAHYPSCGIGGHCIPVDPYYLIERAKKSGFDHKFLKLAREINNGMPAYTVEKLMLALNQLKKSVRGSQVALLGLAYKANIEDIRESPSLIIKKLLENLQAQVRIYDPFVPTSSTVDNLQQALHGADAVILATDHTEFRNIPPRQLKRSGVKVVIDGKNTWDKPALERLGIIYQGIGR